MALSFHRVGHAPPFVFQIQNRKSKIQTLVPHSHLCRGRIFNPHPEIAAPFMAERFGPNAFVGNGCFFSLNRDRDRRTLCPAFSNGRCEQMPVPTEFTILCFSISHYLVQFSFHC